MSTRTPAAPSAGPATASVSATSNPNTVQNLESLQAAAAASNGQAALSALDSSQIIALLRHLPGVFNKLAEQGSSKEAAAETLSNLSQTALQQQASQNAAPQGTQPSFQHQPNIHPQLQHPHGPSEPGPNTHPSGPPSFGMGIMEHHEEPETDGNSSPSEKLNPPMHQGGRKRSAAPPMIGSDEWSRQRKDNHKEVERRRRGNINEGINELARIVPNGTGEKAKGAILSRSIQYILHLKDNEARNIEKWTLEKLLMDQAMGDLQAQLEEVKRMWEEERRGRERAEAELTVLRAARDQEQPQSRTPDEEARQKANENETGKHADGDRAAEEPDRTGKRKRVE